MEALHDSYLHHGTTSKEESMTKKQRKRSAPAISAINPTAQDSKRPKVLPKTC
jgi:hypothetical protein